ncbi:hypothetical protein GCM10029992_37400 [Glycomyces albus]
MIVMIEDLWNDLLAAIYSALFGIKEQLWDTVSGMYYETLYSYFSKSAGPLTDAFTGLVMASYVGVVVAAGLIILSYETLQTKYSLREMIPRLIIAVLLVGLAKEITWQVFGNSLLIVDAFTLTDRVHSVYCDNFPDGSETPIDITECEGYESKTRSVFANHAFMVPTGPNADDPVGLVDVGMQLVSIWCYLTLIVIFLLRNVAWFCVLIMAPLALACHALPQTERFAHYWWRLLGACLASSLGQAALIWVYHQLEGTVADEYVEDYHFQLFYIILIVWLMWKLHKMAFQLARGKTVTAPGSGFLKYLLLNRLMNGRSGGRNHPHRPRRRPRRDDDDDNDQSPRPSPNPNPRPHQPRPGHGNGTPLGGPANGNTPQPGNSNGNPQPTGPVPTPADVSERISRKETKAYREWEEFRRQADEFHQNQTDSARQARDAGTVRRRDRRDEAVAEAIAGPRRDRRTSADSESADGTGSPSRPRRAEDRTGAAAMPPAHRRIAIAYRSADRAAESTDSSSPGESGRDAGSGREGGERS